MVKISVTSPLLLICQPENYWLRKQRILLFNVLNIKITKTILVNKYLPFSLLRELTLKGYKKLKKITWISYQLRLSGRKGRLHKREQRINRSTVPIDPVNATPEPVILSMRRENNKIIVTSSVTKSSVFKLSSVHTKAQSPRVYNPKIWRAYWKSSVSVTD